MQDCIKRAVVSDWPNLMTIFDKALRSRESLTDEDWKKLYVRLITDNYPNFDNYIYIKNNKTVGYIGYCKEEKLIKQLYVLPEYHNQGIGQKLIKYVLDTYNETMTIGVRTNNEVAIHVYTKYGFKKIKEEEYDASGVYLPHYILERKI